MIMIIKIKIKIFRRGDQIGFENNFCSYSCFCFLGLRLFFVCVCVCVPFLSGGGLKNNGTFFNHISGMNTIFESGSILA